MIQEDYVSFETALLLKEKGFEQVGCQKQYNTQGDLCVGYCYGPVAPTLQMVMKWLREVHNIFIEISTSIDLNGDYHFSYTILDKECKYVRRWYTDFDWKYEEAVEAALKYCLENLI